MTVPSVSESLSDYVEDRLGDTLAETFPPGSRKPRHDGWGPDEIAGFLRALAATGIVEHAARAVGRSAQSAYNFRNSRRGRAFARVWDAVLINRSRARLASDLQGRAVGGCVSIRKRDGVVVGEYHYYDNRLAMALLTRLDRLAEKETPSEAHLRALSEDLEDFIDCVAAGGDSEAFVEERKPVEATDLAEPAEPPLADTELTAFARAAGCRDLEGQDPSNIQITDLDPLRQAEWTAEQLLRAFRSGFMTWLTRRRGQPGWSDGPGAPIRYLAERDAADAAAEQDRAGAPPPIATRDLDPQDIFDWSLDELGAAWRAGLIQRLPASFWDDLARAEPPLEAEE